jgi:hypothetical protein
VRTGWCLAFYEDMKALIAALSVLLPAIVVADEVRFRSAEWDSLAVPLKITPFYVEVESPKAAKSVSIEMDVFVKGSFTRTISAAGLSRAEEPRPLALKAAIYFMPPQGGKIDGTVLLEWSGSRSVGKFEATEQELPLLKGMGSAEASSAINTPGRTPLFVIVAGGDGVTMAADPLDAPKRNPTSTVLIGYLKTE